MADRIFPASIRESLGTEREINQINAQYLSSRLAAIQNGEGADASTTTPAADVLAMLREIEAQAEPAEGGDTPETVTAKRAVPEAFLEHQFGPGGKRKRDQAPEKGKDGDGDGDEDGDDCGMEREGDKVATTASTATTRKRKVLFSANDQVNAAALRTAEAQGDDALKNAILSVRDERRERLAANILAESQQIMEREAKLAKRQAYRMSIIESTEAAKKVVAAAQSPNGRVATNANENTRTASRNSSGAYKAPSKMSTAEKSAFAQMALSQGFPAEYVESLLGGTGGSALSSSEQEIRDVMSANLPATTKKAAVAGLVRTAKLSPEQLDRAKRFWKDDLGYGDVEWIDDLFTNKYD